MLGSRGEKNYYQTVSIKNFRRGAGKMDDDWKEFISEEMGKSLDEVMAEIEADPEMKDVESPEGMYDNIMAMIHEHERQEAYEQLSDEDKELIQLGKVYKKQRRFDKFVVALAAVIVGLGIGSVCMGDDENIFRVISTMFTRQERTEINSNDVEPTIFLEEYEVYEKIKEKYNFNPVQLEYLPSQTVFHEAIFDENLQSINMFYMTGGDVNIIYIIRPNYRESSIGTVIADEKVQEYTLNVDGVNITVAEYNIVESGKKRWSISFEYENVQYLLRITDMKQWEIEKILADLCFM